MSIIEQDPPHIEDPTTQSNNSVDGIDTDRGLGEWGEPDEDQGGSDDEGFDWLKLAREAYEASTAYIDANRRKGWEDSIRIFNNQFPQDSKYAQPNYDKRSKIFRPKTRAIIRKHEAAGCSALFSNMDVVSVQAENQQDVTQRISAEVMGQLLQYRLTKTIKWFHVCMGGLQDAQKQGIVCARVFWEYEESKGGIIDRPVVKLIPAENLRIDPAADWMDPVHSSPFIIELIPMFALDVRDKTERPDPKTGKPTWYATSDALIRAAGQHIPDSTRMVREKNRGDPMDTQGKTVQDYEIVWVQRHIHRRDGVDWEFYTLGDLHLLSKPQPLKISTWHGSRDYIMGMCVLETHTAMPCSIPELGRTLQDEANEIANQRLDNVKFVLNKRFIVKRGKNVDLASLVRNVPGGLTLADDPEGDIKELNWPDVTASAFQEQDRINADMDDLLGNFSPSSAMTNKSFNETVGGMQLLNAPSSMMTEYLLRTFIVTFVEPVLRMLVKLEQHYETDETIMALAAQKAQVFMKYGQQPQWDQIMNKDLTIIVNVGMGATDPSTKLQKFIAGASAFLNIQKNAPPGVMNLQEVGKEIFGHLGYQDGTRFMTSDNPEVKDLQGKLQQAQQMIQQLGVQLKSHEQDNQTKIDIAKIQKEGKLEVIDKKQAHENPPEQAMREHVLEAHKVGLEHDRAMMKLQAEMEIMFKKFRAEMVLKMQQQYASQKLAEEAHKHALAHPKPTNRPAKQ